MDRRNESLQDLREQSRIYIETMSALKDLLEKTVPHAEELDEQNSLYYSLLYRVATRLPSAHYDSFFATMLAVIPLLPFFLDEDTKKSRPTDPSLDALSSDDFEEIDPFELLPEEIRAHERQKYLSRVRNPADSKLHVLKSGTLTRIEIRDPHVSYGFDEVLSSFRASLQTPKHSELLHRSMLTMLVGTFEYAVAAIRRAHLRSFPGSLQSDENGERFTLSDILGFETIEDAIDVAVDRRVDAFMRESFDAWAKWFEKGPLRIDPRKLVDDWGSAREVFLRRNVVVHNNGKVSRQYLSKLEKGGPVPHEGEDLLVSPAYIFAAFDNFLVLGSLLLYRSRVAMFASEDADDAREWIVSLQYDLLVAGRNHCASRMSKSIDMSEFTQSQQLLLKINEWIAKREVGELDSCKSEIEDMDVSAVHPRFRLARLVLLEKSDEAVTLLEHLVEQGDISRTHVDEWPLLRTLREAGRITHLGEPGVENDDSKISVTVEAMELSGDDGKSVSE